MNVCSTRLKMMLPHASALPTFSRDSDSVERDDAASLCALSGAIRRVVFLFKLRAGQFQRQLPSAQEIEQFSANFTSGRSLRFEKEFLPGENPAQRMRAT